MGVTTMPEHAITVDHADPGHDRTYCATCDNRPKLTTVQHSALGELRRRGALVPSRHAFGPDGRTFSSRTLDALVAAGYARTEVVRGVPGAPAVAVGIVPIDAPERKPEPVERVTVAFKLGDAWVVTDHATGVQYVIEPESGADGYGVRVADHYGPERVTSATTPASALGCLRDHLAAPLVGSLRDV